jgi:hypothetical protein
MSDITRVGSHDAEGRGLFIVNWERRLQDRKGLEQDSTWISLFLTLLNPSHHQTDGTRGLSIRGSEVEFVEESTSGSLDGVN